MSAATYFISDLHLDPSRPQVIAALDGFLTARQDASALYILGDLFEFWIGDDDDSELAAVVAKQLADYARSGPAVYLMHGNRDFLIGERFASQIGATLLVDPSVVEVGGQRLLLMHGDSLCTRDEDYQRFRALARSPDWQQQALAQSLADRRRLAEQLRTASRDAGSRKAEDIMDVTEDAVDSMMREHQCATLIHGHTHRPARHKTALGERWVLGDWERTGWYIKLESGQLDLIEFSI